MEVKVFEEAPVLMMQRGDGEGRVWGLFNFLEKPVGVKTPMEQGRWQKICDSSSARWEGPGSSLPHSIESSGSVIRLTLEAYSFVLYYRPAERDSPSTFSKASVASWNRRYVHPPKASGRRFIPW